jgi:uncharacterized protein YegP (UPF0339 family)
MKIEIHKSGKHWYFRIVARNGKILAHSEQYTRKRNARETAELISDGRFAIVEAA